MNVAFFGKIITFVFLKKIILSFIIFHLFFVYSQDSPLPKGVHSKISLNEAAIEDIDSENFPNMIKGFDYPNAQISDIVMAMSNLTEINFIIDPGVKGTISIIAPSPITVAEAFQAFLSALAINGFALVRSGAFWKVTTAESASRDNLQIYKGEYFPDIDQYITKVFKLKHTNVKNLEKHLKQFLTKDKHKIMFYEQANTIIVSDYGSAIEKLSQIIKELDVPDVHTVVEVVNIKYALASDLAQKMQTILSQGGRPSFSSSRRAGSNLVNPKKINTTGISAIIPDERTNSIIVSGSQKGINKAKSLIAKLDFYINPQTAGGIYVYYVKHGKAKDLEETLNSILNTGLSSKKVNSKTNVRGIRNVINLQQLIDRTGIQDNIRVTHDKNTNSLLVTSSKHDYDVLKSILAKIDIPKNQVFIKTIIMDLNAEDNLNWDLNYYNFLPNGTTGLLPRFAFSSKNIFDVIMNGIAGVGTGSFLNFGGGGENEIKVGQVAQLAQMAKGNRGGSFSADVENVPLPNVLAFANIIKQKTNGNILSTPQIIAIDNEPSSISVGFNVPVGENVKSDATGSFTGQERKDVATTLEFTPYINPDGKSVRLQIEQKIDSIDPTTRGPVELQGKSVTITKRSIKTNIILNDQETAVLGGLMNEEETERIKKVPILGDIPILGWLFQTKDIDKRKKNLIVFITPRIIRNSMEHKSLLKDKVDEKIDFIKKYMGNTKSSKAKVKRLFSQISPEKKSETARLETTDFEDPEELSEELPLENISPVEEDFSNKEKYDKFDENIFDE